LTLQAGESIETAFGKMVPNGPVPAGTYYAYGATLDVGLTGTATFRIQETDDEGNPVFDELGLPVWLPDLRSATAEMRIPLGATPCLSSPDPSCAGAFSRTVVPLPGAAWLLGTALGTLAWRLGRRG